MQSGPTEPHAGCGDPDDSDGQQANVASLPVSVCFFDPTPSLVLRLFRGVRADYLDELFTRCGAGDEATKLIAPGTVGERAHQLLDRAATFGAWQPVGGRERPPDAGVGQSVWQEGFVHQATEDGISKLGIQFLLAPVEQCLHRHLERC
jgi:hypothetical protein